MNGGDELKAAREQIKSLKKENSDLLDRLHRCEAAAAAAATAAAAQAGAAAAQADAAATQAAARAAAAQSLLEEKHQLEKQVAELKKQVAELKMRVAELEKTLHRRERGQGSSAGSTKDEEVPAPHIAAQLAAAEAGPAAAEAPQLAEGVDGEGQGAGAAAAGSDSEGAGAAVGDLSVQLSGVGLGKLGWAGQAGCLWLSCACPELDACRMSMRI